MQLRRRPASRAPRSWPTRPRARRAFRRRRPAGRWWPGPRGQSRARRAGRELFAPGVGAQAGPPARPAKGTAVPPGASTAGGHSHGPGDRPVTERFTSTDPDDFAVPTGREEEWRFTPLRRLRDLHEPLAEPGELTVEVDRAGPGRGARGRRATPSRSAGPARRPTGSRAGAAAGPPGHRRHRARRAPAWPSRSWSPCAASGETAFGHLSSTSSRSPRPSSSSTTSARRGCAANVELLVGDGATLTVVSVQDWADDAVHVAAARRAARPGRPAAARRGHLRRRPRPAQPDASLRRAGRRRRAARAVLRRRRPAPRAPAVRRPRRAALPEPRHLQGRAAGRGRAHRLDRRRADPRRRPRAPTPTSSTATWCSPTAPAPTRCRTWRSRPARSSAPATPAPPAASTTSSCSTCSPAASRRTRPAGWSSAASSPT